MEYGDISTLAIAFHQPSLALGLAEQILLFHNEDPVHTFLLGLRGNLTFSGSLLNLNGHSEP
jgi:hypothetical protein